MNPELEQRLTEGADPSLIPGVYNYCDRRCERCRFTGRCVMCRDLQREQAAHPNESLAETIERNLAHTQALLKACCERDGIDIDAVNAAQEEPDVAPDAVERTLNDPLVVLGRRYAELTYPILAALEPIVQLRNDQALRDAIETIGWLSTMIAAKVFRAVTGLELGEPVSDGVQTDFNGTAKVTRIAVGDSIAAWRVLMDIGKATADGVPARAVAMLEEIDAALAARFPRAMEFVRPGFDEPEMCTGL